MGLANMEALILLLRSPYTVSSAMLSQKGIAVRASIATARRREHVDLQAGHLSRPQPRPSKILREAVRVMAQRTWRCFLDRALPATAQLMSKI